MRAGRRVELERMFPASRPHNIWARLCGSAPRGRMRTSPGPACSTACAAEYQRRYGLDYAHLAAIAEPSISRTPGATPLAQTPQLGNSPTQALPKTMAANPVIEGIVRPAGLRAGHGWAPRPVILASAALRPRMGARARPVAGTMVAAHLRLGPQYCPSGDWRKTLQMSRNSHYVFPHVRDTMTGWPFPAPGSQTCSDLQGVETP